MTIRRICVLYNPIAGDGRGLQRAGQLGASLLRRGYQVDLCESAPAGGDGTCAATLDRAHAVVIVGGDGTLMRLIDTLTARRLPLYLFPGGNESLAAREFGHRRSAGDVLVALKREVVEERYFGLISGRPFFSMVSIGLDSVIIADIAARRHAPIGRLGYVTAALRQAPGFRAPVLRVRIDDRIVLDGEAGYLVVGNTKHYALGLDFVEAASSFDGALQARFFAGASLGFYLRWLGAAACRRPFVDGASLSWRGASIAIEELSGQGYPVQADGEASGSVPAVLSKSAARLCVLSGA